MRPLIVASTATVRNAQEQVRGLYGRQVEIFPPQVLDVADTYFSQEVPIDRENPGRRYIGVSAQGVRLSSAEIRVVGGAAVGGAAAVRPRGCCRRPVHDARRLLQRHPRAGGHGALHGRRRRRTGSSSPRQGLGLPPPLRRGLRQPQHRRADLAHRLRRDRTRPWTAWGWSSTRPSTRPRRSRRGWPQRKADQKVTVPHRARRSTSCWPPRCSRSVSTSSGSV